MTTIKGLLVMDVDSTLVQEEVIDLLGEEAGVGEQVAQITERAMRGELDFKEALDERVATLAGLSEDIFDKVYKRIHFNKGAKELVAELHARGYKVGLVSGGFHETVDRLAKEAGVDYVKANHLEVKDGKLTGKVYGDIVTKDVKVAKLKEWAAENGLALTDTIAMGDGANDLPMIQTAGIGIAFCAKPIVREQAPYQINEADLYKVIDILDEVKKGTRRINNLTDFLTFILKSEKDENYNYYYRGEPSYYDLRTPSLYLNEKLSLDGSEKYYRTLFNELGIDDYQDNATLVRKLAELQHYGAKTRILDITSNPLVALYFAVEKDDENEGYVYFFKEKNEEEKYDTEKTVAIKSAINLIPKGIVDDFFEVIEILLLSTRIKNVEKINLTIDDILSTYYKTKFDTVNQDKENKEDKEDKEIIVPNHTSKEFIIGNGRIVSYREFAKQNFSIRVINEKLAYINFFEFIKGKVNTFLKKLNQVAKVREELKYPFAIYDDLRTSHIVLHSKNTSRIKQQQGAFIYPRFTNVSNHGNIKQTIHNSIQEKAATLSNESVKDIERIIIPHDSKDKIRKELALIGITPGFIYPDIEHISNSLL